MMDKVKIISYSNLAKPSGEVDDSFKPHRKDLCAKCLKGKPCTAA
jgi:hypothetical protein